ncbi:MAG: histidine kinase N-terminal 7TM domain-containing protein [Candidatus Methanofastidiosia archaeon]
MIWQQTPYTIPLIGISIVSIILGVYIWWRFRRSWAIVGALLILASAEWTLGYALELGSGTLSLKIFWNKVQFIGIAIIPVSWLLYMLHYTGHEKWITRRTVTLLSIIPSITLLLVFTNEYHTLIWTSFFLDTEGPFPVLHQTHGIWFWFHIGYSYILIMCGFFPLVQMVLQEHLLFRWQTLLFIIGSLVPFGGNILQLSGLNPVPHLELTPLGFPATIVVIVLSILFLRLGDIVPVAREIIIEGMSDSVIVLDADNHIIDLNPAAQQLMGTDCIGQPIQCWPHWSDLKVLTDHQAASEEIMVGPKDNQRVFDVRISSLTDWRDNLVSQIIVLRDITERKKVEEKIKSSLKEKEVLLREIHHRVKNNLQIVSSLLNLQSQYIKDKEYTNMINESQNRIRSMALIHEKLYQSEELARINADEYIKTLVKELFRSYAVNTNWVTPTMDIEDIPLSVDTAIPLGLIINELVSNSLKHAFPHKKGEIKVIFHSSNGDMCLSVIDDGIGLPGNINFKTTKTLGLRLVTILAKDQLDGDIELNRAKGTAFHITFKE